MNALRPVQVGAMAAGSAVHVHLSDGTAAVSSPRLGRVLLSPQLARRCAELVYLQPEHGGGDANMPVALI